MIKSKEFSRFPRVAFQLMKINNPELTQNNINKKFETVLFQVLESHNTRC